MSNSPSNHEANNVTTTPARTPQGEAAEGNQRRVSAHSPEASVDDPDTGWFYPNGDKLSFSAGPEVAPRRRTVPDPVSRRIRDAVLEIERDRLDARYAARYAAEVRAIADADKARVRSFFTAKAEECPPCSYCCRSACTGECLYD